METSQLYVIDTTLRDGAQAPGVVFDIAAKYRIAELLELVGVEELELGVPVMDEKEFNDIKALANSRFNFATSSWCRALRQDIVIASETGTTGVNISFPVSETHLKVMGKNSRWVFQQMSEIIPFAKSLFSKVFVGLQDATRANAGFLSQCIKYATYLGADRIRIADTVGCFTPMKTSSLCRDLLLKYPNTNFEFHFHNDFGMATANAIMAAESGVKSMSMTVNGMGERAGNTALEEFLMTMRKIYACEKYDCKYLDALSAYVYQQSGREKPASKAITGDWVCSHESGIHANAMIKDQNAYQSFSGLEVGKAEVFNIAYGKHSGRKAIHYLCEMNGIHLSGTALNKFLSELKAESEKQKRSFSETELLDMLKLKMLML